MFIASKDGKYGIINSNKEEKLPFEYSTITFIEKADLYIVEDSNYNAKILNSNLETKAEGILSEFLLKNKAEVIKISIYEYDKEFEEKKLRKAEFEYGQPELTVYPNGKAELTTEPTMSDLPKDTVIYNHKLLWSYIVIYMYKFI